MSLNTRTNLNQGQLLQLQTKGMQMSMKSGRKLETMADLEKIYYPWLDKNNPLASLKLKADDPILTSTGSFLTTTYGPVLWNQLNMEANAFGLLELEIAPQ